MAQLTQMTRFVSSWLGWTPASASTFDCCLSAKEEPLLQESSGFVTVMALYLAMTLVLVAVSFCSSGKASSSLRDKRELAPPRPWRSTAPGMALAKLIRQLGRPKRSRHERQRLRIRLRRHLEQELKLVRELQEQGQKLGLLDWQDAEEAVEEPTYFDLPSEAEQ